MAREVKEVLQRCYMQVFRHIRFGFRWISFISTPPKDAFGALVCSWPMIPPQSAVTRLRCLSQRVSQHHHSRSEHFHRRESP